MLLMLYACNKEPIEGTLKLQKLMFLLEKELIEKGKRLTSDFYYYVPYRLGPMSIDVYDEIETLTQYKLVDTRRIGEKTVYKLTDKGERLVRNVLKDNVLVAKILKEIEALKKKFNAMSDKELLRYVYSRYPMYAIRSEIKSLF